MTGHDLLDTIGDAKGTYILEAQQHREGTAETAGKTISFRRIWFIAALIALMLLLVGCTVAYVQGWFTAYFAERSDTPLSSEQIAYIEENEQVIAQTQTQNEWTVEVKSAMNDGTKAYIIIGVTAPENVSLARVITDDVITSRVEVGNDRMGNFIAFPDGVFPNSMTSRWEDDGDGLANTENLVIQINPDFERSTAAPFGSETQWKIHIENIIRISDNTEYRQELLNGKYAGQDGVMFEQDEIEKLYITEVLVEGTWDFTIHFEDNDAGVELLTEPVASKADVRRRVGPEIWEYETTYEDVTMTSFILKPLTATIYYECDGGVNFTDFKEKRIFVILKDGSQIELEHYGDGGEGYAILDAKTPIVLENVAYILMSDGTKLSMPE